MVRTRSPLRNLVCPAEDDRSACPTSRLDMMAKMSQNKRPVRQLSIHEKLEAIQRVHEGESKASVARIIGVPESTLRGWCKNEDKLTALANKSSPSPEPEKPDGPSEAKRSRLENESLWYWLSSQHQQPMAHGLKENENSSWFWRWYKQYGFQMPPKESLIEPLPLVKSKSTLDNVFFNLNNNNRVREEWKENRATETGEGSEDEDDPPETADEALKHGEKFLRWLECCSDPSVTAVQLLQFRYLLNNVRSCAERRATRQDPAPRTKRK